MKVKRIFAASALVLSLSVLNSCADWFQGKVDMEMDVNNITLGTLFYEKVELNNLDSPAQLFVSQGLYPGKIELKWSEVENATSYRIEKAVVTAKNPDGSYSLPDESEFSSVTDYCYGTSYTDTILINPTNSNAEYGYHYFYRVSAENFELSIESEPTDLNKTDTRGEGWLFPAPVNLEADKGKSTSQVKLTWNKNAEASKYKIYRTEKPNGTSLELIDTVYGNQNYYVNEILNAEQGTEFYYKVVAQNEYGNDSAYSSIAMGYSLKEGAPTAPQEVIVNDGFATSKSRLSVRWSSVTTTGDVTYTLYRSSSVDSAYTLIKSKITSTSYTDETKSLEPGVIYYYYVQTISTDRTTQEISKSPFSEKSVTSFGFLLSPPSNVDVEDSEISGNVKLVWTPAIGSEYLTDYKYNIYYSNEENGAYTALVSNITKEESDGKISFDIEKKNFYCISTLNDHSSDDEESALSKIAAPIPGAPQNVRASKTERIEGKFEPNKNNVYPVKITWDKPESDSPYGYLVYRSTKPDSSFRKIQDEPVRENEIIDAYDSAKSGTVYYYKVISVNSLGQGKKGNNPEEDYIKADGSGPDKIDCLGYGALTRDQWFREYNKTVMNSQKKLTLMHKPVDTDKLGKETVKGNISGTLSYDAHLKGLGAEIIMPYKDYADYYIDNNSLLGVFMILNGNNDTSSNMNANGKMSGTVRCKGMYPGNVDYSTLEIKGGAAGGGFYGLETYDLNGNELDVITNKDNDGKVSDKKEVHWLVGEEGR